MYLQAGKREGIIAVWKFLDSYRERLVFQTQKFQHEKYLFDSDRATALKTLEDKLENHPEKTAIADETTGSQSELIQQNSSLKSAFQAGQLELQSLVEHRKNDKLFYENRISQLEADVIRLEQERDQWPKKVHPSEQLEFCVQTGMDKVLPVTLSTKERDGKSASLIVCSEPFDDVNKQLDPSDSNGSEVVARTPDTSSLDSLDRYKVIFHVIETSSSQFTMALGSYNKILNNLCKLELTQSVWVQVPFQQPVCSYVQRFIVIFYCRPSCLKHATLISNV